MPITWEGVLGVLALVGFFGGLIARDIRLQLKSFSDDIIVRLDNRYVLRKECQLITHQLEPRDEA